MSNPYAAFLNLLPRQIKYLAKIISVDSTNGTVVVEKVGGNTRIIVKGGTDSYTVDEYVFIIDEVVASKVDNVQSILEQSVI